MSLPVKALCRVLLLMVLCAFSVGPASSASRDELSPWPHDLSPAGMRAAAARGLLPERYEGLLPERALGEVREYLAETRRLGLERRSGTVSVANGPTNVRANNPAGDRIGETQSEVAVAVFGDTVIVGWNDSQGFLAGNTLSSYAYSTDGGASFTDGGDIPLALPTDQAFGDPGIDTDERGNWYYNQIYTRAAGAPGATAQQNIGVHHGTFSGGILTWDAPTMASIGTSATGNLDKCLLACDRVTGNVYTAYTRFTATAQIEVVRSTTLGLTWDPPVVLDNTTTPTSSKQSARPFCGPNGEVYVVWEKGANTINCPDGLGNVVNTTGQIGFARSLNFGVSYGPYSAIGTVDHSWTWSGPGDLRERANDFPDIAVDRSGGPFDGQIYVTWHESAPWTASLLAGPARAEAADAANNNPGGAETFFIGDDVTGTISASGDFDYWQFSATQGQSLLLNLDPSTFVCGTAGTSDGMRLRLFATQSPYPNPTGFPDSLLAASALGAFAQRIVWTAPSTANYLLRLQRSSGAASFSYRLRVRSLAFGAPSAGRDARDIVVIRSSNQGGSWSTETRINDDPTGLENRRPFVSVDGLGHAHIFWHDSRSPGLGTNASLTTIFGTTSRDGGATWGPNFCVTDEPSFFSFNTLAIPNLGDYNQSASSGAVTFPAWSDQRISTGDVRTPGTNTFTAGRGPDAYTVGVFYDFSLDCPDDTTAFYGVSLNRTFRITNTGNLPDVYAYSITDVAGWLVGPVAGLSPTLQPGESFDIAVKIDLPDTCDVKIDTLLASVTPVGDLDGAKSCEVLIDCAGSPVGVGDLAIAEFALGAPSPNPTTGACRFGFSLPRETQVRLSVIDVQGREIAVLVDGIRSAGRHAARWDGRNGLGHAATGLYFIRFGTPGRDIVRRLALTR